MTRNKFNIIHFVIVNLILLVIVFCLLFYYEANRIKGQYQSLALETAESYLQTIVVLRKWNAAHNGVYVPVTEKLQPNPYLVDPLRDLEASNGMHLTKINPAYMTRLFSEIASQDLEINFRISSLNPLNPQNMADRWEQEALLAFEEGITSRHEIVAGRSTSYLRYMAPLVVEEPCLQCHGSQGYQIGDIKGGIAVSLPYGSFLEAQNKNILHSATIYFLALSFIVGAVIIFSRKSIAAKKELLKLSKAVEQCGNSIIITDKKGRVEYVNPKFCEITGFSSEEILGGDGKLFRLENLENNLYQQVWQELAAGVEWRGELQNRKKNGEIYWEKASIAPVKDQDGEIINYIAIKEDITRSKENQVERERLIKELERSNKELETFAYIASHDLREPLRKVTSFGQLLKASLEGRLDDDEQENLEFMIDGAGRLQQMIDDLLSYSRVTTQGKPFQKVDLNEVVRDLQENTLFAKLMETGGQIRVPKPLPMVLGDWRQILQLMQNLMDNGIKYRRPGETPVININALEIDSGMVKIEITDNGIGIEEKYHDLIFTMFKRLHGRGKYEGTGLGLAICKKIVERHWGTIGLESTPGRGACFWFTLPLYTSENDKLIAGKEDI